jgi:PKD repeat protein
MEKLSHRFFVIASLILTIGSFVYAQIPFYRQEVANNFDRVAGLCAADLDNDGRNDIIGAAINSNEVAWWCNSGGNPIAWTKQTVDNNFGGAITVVVADIDGDSNKDIVAAAANVGVVAWFHNNGGNPIVWTKQIIAQNFTDAHGIKVCDLDNDGDLDVIATAAGLNKISWFENSSTSGDGSEWIEHVIAIGFNYTQSVDAADFDNDGRLDIVAAAGQGNEVAWWRNEGGQPPTWTKNTIEANFTFAHCVVAKDVDNDGKVDVIGAAYTLGQIALWKNRGGNPIVWTKQVIDQNFSGALTVCVSDIDMDGKLDVVGAASAAGEIAWWRNNGGSTISWSKFRIDTLRSAWPVATSDLDGDGDLDVLAGSESSDKIVLWKSGFVKSGFLASAVSGEVPLTIDFTDASIPSRGDRTLSWDFDNDGNFDSHESNPSFTYNKPGIYSVKLVVTQGVVSDTLIRNHYIEARRRTIRINKLYQKGWNLLSMPVESFSSVSFPSLFDYAGKYCRKDTLISGRGYWAQPVSDVEYSGYHISSDTLDVFQKWNIIGSISEPVPVANIYSMPPDIIVSNFFWYDKDSGYTVADTIQPGKGYWVKVNQDGKLVLSSVHDGSSATFKRMAKDSELPPPPPSSLVNGKSVPNEFKLAQNYPNPFNPTTAIHYQLPIDNWVTLKVYNTLGQEAMTLVDGMESAGYKSVTFDASKLPSGIYIYRFVSGTFMETKKMLLLR